MGCQIRTPSQTSLLENRHQNILKIVPLYFSGARGMVRPFIKTHQAETRTKTRIKLHVYAVRRPHTQSDTDQGGLKQARCIDLQVFSKLVESTRLWC